MNQSLLEKVTKLKTEIDNSPEVKELNRLNSLLENDEEVMKLCYKKDCAVTNYEDAFKHFGENSKEVIKAQKELHEAKLNLDSNPLVKKYMDLFDELKAAQPDAEIYVQGILPICEELAKKRSYSVTNHEIDQINAYLKDVSFEKEFWYLDLPSVYKTESGELSPENTSNGIRLLPESYQSWYEYLLTHKVVH